jgi:spore germination protein
MSAAVVAVLALGIGTAWAGVPSTTVPTSSVGVALRSTTTPVPTAARRQSPFAVTGFQEEGTPSSRITASAGALTTVGVDGVNISADGGAVGRPDSDARNQLAVAHRDHLRAELLIGNYSDAIGDFSELEAHRLFSSNSKIDAVVAELVRSVRTEGWDGLSVDLESLSGRDGAGLVTFLRTLRAELPAGRTVSVCVSNRTSAAGFRQSGYELAAIGATVSRVILMGYDEHGTWGTPGPVGALAWQRAGIRVVLRSVPAAKLDLGVAGYGYAWRPGGDVQLGDAAARRLALSPGARASFDRRAGEWTAHLPDGSTIWWSDARSFALRVGLAHSLHLHGLAVWSLGLSDPLRLG